MACRACYSSDCRQRPAEGIKALDFPSVETLVGDGLFIRTRSPSVLTVGEDAVADYIPPPRFSFGFGERSGLHTDLD